jgi:hypothetical protein
MDDDELSLCIGMCIYNNRNGVPYILSNLSTIYKSGIFKRLRFVFIYEHHDPGFYELKADICNFAISVPMAVVDIIPNTYKKENVRQRNIGHARNSFLDYLRKLRSSLDATVLFSHFAFMDFNNYACVGPIDTGVLKEAMQMRDQWDSVSFLREAGYYDMWALSFDPYIHSFFHFKRGWWEVLERMRTMFDRILVRAIQSGKKLLPVYSAFNGFALYRCDVYLSDEEPRIRYTDDIQTAYYPRDVLKSQMELVDSKTDGRINDDCEHRYFHMVSAQPPHNARIFIFLKNLFKKVPDSTTLTYTPRAPV